MLLAGIWITKRSVTAAPQEQVNDDSLVFLRPFSPTAVDIGGTPMYSSKNIAENLAQSNQHTELAHALNETGLGEML